MKLVALPARTLAAIRFSWPRNESRVEKKKAQLLSLLARDGVKTKSEPEYAGYNAPWTPPWMTRNEILVELAK